MAWEERFEREIRSANRARQRGNEGQARVCARRAAGIAAAEFYERRGEAGPSESVVVVLERLQREPSLPADLTPILTKLLQQVDTHFKLPPGVDLVAEAQRLRQLLLHE